MFIKLYNGKYFIFAVLFCIFAIQLFGQDLSQKFSIPVWVRMGMSKADIEKKLSDNKWTYVFSENSNGFIAYVKSLEDEYYFQMNDKKGLVWFEIRTKDDIKKISDTFIKLYGNSNQNDRYKFVWDLKKDQLQNVMTICIFNNDGYYLFNNNIVKYYFSNNSSSDVESNILTETMVRISRMIETGEYDIVIREVSNILSKDPHHDAAYNIRGEAYLGKGDVDKAISDFNQAIQLSPNRKNFHGNRADAYRRKENYTSALADYNAEIRIQPDNYYAYAGRGVVYINQNKIDLAIVDLKQACDSSEYFCQFSPHHGYLLGDLYHRYKNNYQEAIKYYTLSLKAFEPKGNTTKNDDIELSLYIARARAYIGLEKNDLALTDLAKVLNVQNLKEIHFDAYFTRGIIFYTQKKYNEAISDISNFLRSKIVTDENKVAAYHLRGRSYVLSKNSSAALNDFNELFKLSKGREEYPEDYYLRGLLLFDNKKYSDSISDFDNFLKIRNLSKEQKIDGYRYRAKAYMNLKEYYNALEDFNEVYNLNPKDEEAIKAIVVLCRELGIEP